MNFLCRWCKSRLLRQRAGRMTPQPCRLAHAGCHERAMAGDIVRGTHAAALADAGLLRAAQLLKQQVLLHMVHVDRNSRAIERRSEQPSGGRLLEPRSGIAGRVHRTPAGLSDEQRRMVTLVDLGGCSHREVAAVLDLSVGSVVQSLCEIRAWTKERLLRRRVRQPAPVISLEGL
ncbi:MAG: sigma factor-like helix-turn-helix DNA-binding protein [Gammaproteobacteria bacterium]